MAKKTFFGNNIEPSCTYCSWGNISHDGNMILCEKQGIVETNYSCKKFVYDPILRIPSSQPILKEYSKEDFEI